MRYVEKAVAIVVEAQKKLVSLIAQASEEQEFSAVAEIAAMAEALKGSIRIPTGANTLHNLYDAPSANGDSSSRSPAEEADHPLSSSPYPRFERERDRLVKIGWSKRDRRTYEHRAPREVISAVVGGLSQRGRRGDVFTVEQVLPVKLQSGEEAPSYQVYMALALLRATGAVKRHGKDGYSLVNGAITPEDFNQIWNTLPEHH
jgi:hypothetical protein